MGNFEFKSQVATTREQSERLLALGLKKETADMVILEHPRKEGRYFYIPKEDANVDGFPAWSLHRLLCLYGLDYTIKEVYNSAEECYGMLISAIGIAIEDGMFNKDYLENEVK